MPLHRSASISTSAPADSLFHDSLPESVDALQSGTHRGTQNGISPKKKGLSTSGRP